MREEELDKSRISQFMPASTFMNLFENRLNRMPGKKENVQIMINADVENSVGNKKVITQKSYGPFRMEMPQMNKDHKYKFMIYTLLQHKFTIPSISAVGARITVHTG